MELSKVNIGLPYQPFDVDNFLVTMLAHRLPRKEIMKVINNINNKLNVF